MPGEVEVPVLIIGGGPVGLAASILLSRFGVRSLLAERHRSTTDHPKARGVHARTMELFRQWGVEAAIRNHELSESLSGFIWVDRLDGAELGRVPLGDMQDANLTTTRGSIVSQDAVEEQLRAAAEQKTSADVRFSMEAVIQSNDTEGVTAVLRDGEGSEQVVRARYVIAADGASSRTRDALGIAMNGPDSMGHSINIYFRADLTKWVASRPCVGFFFSSPALVGSTLLCVNGTDRWISINRAEPGEEFSNDRCVRLIRDLVGAEDLNVSIINTAHWTMTAQVATSYRAGRVFLAGDAAHRFPPTGGFGMNTGIQDIHNLVWKLAFVLGGRAGESLLETYEGERKPIAQSNTDFSVTNAIRLGAMHQAVREGDRARMAELIVDQRKHLANLGQQLGFHYDSTAVVSDGTAAPEFSPYEYVPTGRPGHRAPHLWLENKDGLPHTSTLDLFDRNFALLTAASGEQWRAFGIEGRDFIAPYTIGVGGNFPDPQNRFRDLYGIEPDGAVLVRPDGVVAWRARNSSSASPDDLKRAVRTILGIAA